MLLRLALALSLASLFTICFKNWFWDKETRELSYLVLTLISLFSFLLSYQLLKAISKKHFLKSCNKLDLIFICLFFVALCVPASHISKEYWSRQEQRQLAVLEPLVINDGLNQNFGKNFEAWLNDRFYKRRNLIKLNTQITSLINQEYHDDSVLLGQDNWLFFKLDNSIANYKNEPTLSEGEQARIISYITELHAWCKTHNKKFYLFVASDKNKIYGEHFPPGYDKVKPDSESTAATILKQLKQHEQLRIIYPYQELMQAKSSSEPLLYFKHDTHWTHHGAFIGYTELMKAISKDFDITACELPRMEAYKMHDADLSKMAAGGGFKDNTSYFRPLEENNFSVQELEGTRRMIYKNNAGTLKAFILRDSFFTAMAPFIGKTFEQCYIVWRYNLAQDDMQMIIDEGYDIVILELLERYIPNLSDFNIEKN